MAINTKIIAGAIVHVVSISCPSSMNRLVCLLRASVVIMYSTVVSKKISIVLSECCQNWTTYVSYDGVIIYRHTSGTAPLDEGSAPLGGRCLHSKHKRRISMPFSGIRTRNPRCRADRDVCVIPHYNRDRVSYRNYLT
jgi:hypothetical protein